MKKGRFGENIICVDGGVIVVVSSTNIEPYCPKVAS